MFVKYLLHIFIHYYIVIPVEYIYNTFSVHYTFIFIIVYDFTFLYIIHVKSIYYTLYI